MYEQETWERFIEAMAEIGRDIEEDDVVQTGDTVDSFYAQWGYRLDRQGHKPPKPYEQESTEVGDVHHWKDIQVRKGFRRGDLYVMNMGDYRLTFFDGES